MEGTISTPPRAGKVYAARLELKEQIRKTKAELHTAGPIHRKDLSRHLRHLQTDLRQYDRLRRGGA